MNERAVVFLAVAIVAALPRAQAEAAMRPVAAEDLFKMAFVTGFSPPAELARYLKP